MNEVISKPWISLWIEQGLQPIDKQGHSADAPRVRMVRHPNLDMVPNPNIDGHKIAAQGDDVGAQSANSHSQFHRAGMSYACVCAQRDDAFNAWQFREGAESLLRLLVDLAGEPGGVFLSRSGLSVCRTFRCSCVMQMDRCACVRAGQLSRQAAPVSPIGRRRPPPCAAHLRFPWNSAGPQSSKDASG